MRRMGMLAAVALAGSAGAAGPAHSDLATRFGAREWIGQIGLSPDGTRVVAVVAGPGRSHRAAVFTLADKSKTHLLLTDSGGQDQLSACSWASDSRIVCSYRIVHGHGREAIAFSRMVSISPEGTDLKLLTATTGNETEMMQNGGAVIDWLADGAGLLMTRQVVPTETGATVDTTNGLAVERVDPTTLKRSIVERPLGDAREYITDGHGTVRIIGRRGRDVGGYDAKRIDYFYRLRDGSKWLPLSQVTGDSQTESGFDPYAVDRDLNVAYGFDDKGGRRALYKVALDGSLKRDLVAANDQVDIDALIRIGRQRRVVGISYATDRRVTEFFDPDLKRLQGALGRALTDHPLISFVDASADETKLLLWTGSDTDPGQYAIFDKHTRHFDALADVRPELDGLTLAPVKPITFPAADGTPIPGYLTLPPGSSGKGLPAIVMPHGGPSDRDEWGFDWLVQFYAARGFAVLQPNFRGSTGYGAAWFQQNGFRSWQTAIGDVDEAGRWLVKQGIAAPGKLAIVGWSYGGYAALQSGVLDPGLYKAIVAIAPVTDLDQLRAEHQNYGDYRLVDAFIGRGPHLKEGSPAKNAGRIAAPVLLFHGDRDENVLVDESRLMQARLKAAGKQVDYLEFKGLDHQLDDSDARAELLDRSDAFLRKAMGLGEVAAK